MTFTPLSGNPIRRPPEETPPASIQAHDRPGDRIFRGVSVGSGVLILVTLGGVALFLMREAYPALADPSQFDKGFLDYVAPYLFGTVWSAFLALLLATVPAVAVALYVSHYAPPVLARTLGLVIDLLAAIPSVVYGLWGIFVVAPVLASSVFPWLEERLVFLPFFEGPTITSGRTMLTVAVVLAVMILPIITAISREVFMQTPGLHQEAALALGATKWEMIKMAVLPYSRSGIISGAMLGLGRALGETMAVAIILSPASVISFNLLGSQNPNTIAANIALDFPESSGLDVNRLIATGLVLFVLTFAVNFLARYITNKRADFSGAN
ncbi:MAG: phosphate ABC transporter permease subunit PstC [Acidimicrobiales bacterium]